MRVSSFLSIYVGYPGVAQRKKHNHSKELKVNPYQYQVIDGDFRLKKVPTGAGSQKHGPCEYCKKNVDTMYLFSLYQAWILITNDPILFAFLKGNFNLERSCGSLFAHSTCGDEWAESKKARLKKSKESSSEISNPPLLAGSKPLT